MFRRLHHLLLPSRGRAPGAATLIWLGLALPAVASFPQADEIAICLGYGVENSDSCVNDVQETPNPVTSKCDGGGEDFYAVNSTFHPYWKARGVYFEVFDWDSGDQTGFVPNSG